MGKDHLKCMALPKSWPLQRKERTFVTRPFPGGHSLSEGMALGTVMKELLDLSTTNRETRHMLHTHEVLLDGKRRKDLRSMMGLFDVLSVPHTKEYYRMVLTGKGKLAMTDIPAKEANTKVCGVKGKSMNKGKIQVQLTDGRNILVDKGDYKVGDSVVISLPDQKITKHLALAKGAQVLLTGGKHKGQVGTVEDIQGTKIMYKTHEGVLSETRKQYAYVIGKDKPEMTSTAKQ